MTWVEWLLAGLMVFAAVDIVVDLLTVLIAEKDIREKE